jgi:hypothetical protein
MLTTSAETLRRRALAAGIAGLACAFAAASVTAATQIGVAVEIVPNQEGTSDRSMMALQWTATKRADIQREVEKRFAEQLQKRYRYWKFAPVTDPVDATLHLKLVELADGGSTIVFDLTWYPRRLQNQSRSLWRREWMPPGAALENPLPPVANAPAVIATALKKIERTAEEQQITDWLTSSVPIGSGGRWSDPAPGSVGELKLVIAVPQDAIEGLKDSKLRVFGLRSQGPATPLPVVAGEDQEPFELQPGQPILGLVVFPDGSSAWSTLTVQSARQLKIGSIHLEKEGPGMIEIGSPAQ